MTEYVLRKDADDFTRKSIAEGWDIEIVDEIPGKFSKTIKIGCPKCKDTSKEHHWNGSTWVCDE